MLYQAIYANLRNTFFLVLKGEKTLAHTLSYYEE